MGIKLCDMDRQDHEKLKQYIEEGSNDKNTE